MLSFSRGGLGLGTSFLHVCGNKTLWRDRRNSFDASAKPCLRKQGARFRTAQKNYTENRNENQETLKMLMSFFRAFRRNPLKGAKREWVALAYFGASIRFIKGKRG